MASLDGCPRWFEGTVRVVLAAVGGLSLYRFLLSLDDGGFTSELVFVSPLGVFLFGNACLLFLLQVRRQSLQRDEQ